MPDVSVKHRRLPLRQFRRWIIDRCEGRVGARETPIGYLPEEGAIDTTDLDISAEIMRVLTSVDVEHWTTENEHFANYLDGYGKHVPQALREQQQRTAKELEELQ